MKCKQTAILLFAVIGFLYNSLILYAGPLPLSSGAENKSENAYFNDIPAYRHLPSAQTHAGPLLGHLDAESHHLYQLYFERYSSPVYIRWLSSVMERADIYVDFIDKRIHENQVPPELLYLPIIESAYRYNAVSRSGAVGLWQFMLNSISPYDMVVNDWLDERRDFWKSTEGAIAKLIYNHRVLGGDWLLALAAYNCGLGRIQRTIAATGINNYWELADKGLLPAETTHYVPKLLAIAGILMNGGRMGVDIEWRKPVAWERVKLSNPVSLSLLSEKTGIPHQILKTANAELRYDITPPGRIYYLKVPEGEGHKVAEVLKGEKDSLVNFHLYQIKQGDTLYDLGRHYGVTVAMIQSYNRNINPMSLRPGSKILVPAVKQVSPYPGKPSPAAAAEQKASKSMPDDPSLYKKLHIVQPGETLWSISRKYSTTPDNLAFHNGIKTESVLSIGMELKVPEGEL